MPLHATSSNKLTSPKGLPASVKPLGVSENLTDVQNGFGTPLEDTFETRANPRQSLEASSPKLHANPTALLAVIAPLLMGSIALAVGFYGLMKGHKAEINALEQKALNQSENAAQALEAVANKVKTLETAQADAKIKIQTLASTVEHQTQAILDLQVVETEQSKTVAQALEAVVNKVTTLETAQADVNNQLETKIETKNTATKNTVQLMLTSIREYLPQEVDEQLNKRDQAKTVRSTMCVGDDDAFVSGYNLASLASGDLASYEFVEGLPVTIWAETAKPVSNNTPSPVKPQPAVVSSSSSALIPQPTGTQNAILN